MHKISLLLVLLAPAALYAQAGGLSPEAKARRWAIEKELDSLAVIDRKVMVPMRDGIRMATDVYRPKDTTQAIPGHLLADAVQLQLLGRAPRRARRHDRRARRA